MKFPVKAINTVVIEDTEYQGYQVEGGGVFYIEASFVQQMEPPIAYEPYDGRQFNLNEAEGLDPDD